jgi:parallel beta-helix repeat protein
MKRKGFSILFALVLVLGLSMVTAAPVGAADSTFTFPGGSLTTTDTSSWGGYNSHSYGPHFNVDAGPLTIEYLGVNAYPINYTGDFGWPPDPTDTGASVIVGVGNGINIAQYSFKSNMSGNKPRGTDPETYGKGSWDHQNIGHWNDDGYRSYLFQGQFTDNWVATVGNSQYNAEKHGGPTGNDPDYDTFDFKFYVEKVAPNTYEVTGWHNLWKSSAIDEGCYWDWNYAKNAHDAAKRGYLKCFEGTWTADGGLDLSDVQVFLGIQNWQGTQPELHNFDWDGVVVTGTVIPPDEVWVDDNWVGSSPGDLVDGHTFGYDAFATIQDGIDNVAGSTVHVAAGTYDEEVVIDKSLTLISDTGDYRTTGAILNGPIALSDVVNVTIQGFKFRDCSSSGYKHVIYTGGTADNITIVANSFDNCEGLNIHIYKLDTWFENWTITDNKITNVTGTDRSGIWVQRLRNSIISNNEISNTTYAGMILDRIESVTVSNNNISNTPKKGIQVASSPNCNVVIENNYITNTNTSHDADEGAITIYPDVTNIHIENNTLTANYQGFTVRDKSGTVSDVYVNFNNIYGNDGFGVGNFAQGGGTVDATKNWWGSANGPTHPSNIYNVGLQGDDVSDNVDFCPWLNAPYPGGVCDWGPVKNLNTGEIFCSIQSAIDDDDTLDGHTIEVGSGTYYENVKVRKELTIRAASSPIVDGGGSGSCVEIYHASGLSGVTIDGFELKNATRGIWIYGAPSTYNDITLSNNNIHDHVDNGILVTDATVNGFTICGNTVNNSGIGISFDRAIVDGLAVDGNEITNGNVGLAFFSGSYSSVEVSNCYFEGNAWEHIDLGAWGKWPSLSSVYMTGCQFLSGSCWCGVYIQSTFASSTDIVMNFNEFLTGQWGVYVDTAIITPVDARYNWWGDVSGPWNPWDIDGLNQYNPDGLGDTVSEYVLYDPWIGQEGMATGGGWFIPEASSAHGLVNPGGKATFGFVAKQKNETSSGQLEFQYHADDLKLKSTSYDWVSVASVQVMFEGEGVLNGVPGYKFRVWAFDGDKAGGQPDRFTIRIWIGDDSYGSPTYRAEGDLGGGQIVVHKK